MSKFNIGKFNLKGDATTSITSTALLTVGATCKSVFVKKYTITKQITTVRIGNDVINPTNIITVIPDASDFKINNDLLPSVFVFSHSNNKTSVRLNAEAISALLGESYIELQNINLKPGEEIEINMCDLTVTKNGENAIHLITNDGDFFDFLIGLNNVLIEGADTAEIDIYWKDKWL